MANKQPVPLPAQVTDGDWVVVRGGGEHNLKNVNVAIPRNALAVFSSVSGSGKSSPAFGTIYAEAQRPYFESVAPYARGLSIMPACSTLTAAGGCASAAERCQQRVLVGGQRDHAFKPGTDDVLAGGPLSVGQPFLNAEDFSANTPQVICPSSTA
ncbi:hypothetical protein [Klebsiella pneumoniae]|uniref:hypothetical protein n=1 Tax=Klebsiella pneumoniae TaxID=573 RepID=UPI002020B9C6|nr:hypothetical protein [Klebsiella pneumoniae]MCL8021671.1 hypothetical protein [Klebsiella pneumoniae]